MSAFSTYGRHQGGRLAYSVSYGGDLSDPFAINPIRRSVALVLLSVLIVGVPLLIGGPAATTMLLAAGWLGVTGFVIGVPILIWSLAEEGWRWARRRLYPSVDQLAISPRIINILRRHGLESIAAVDQASDTTLLLLSNMDARGVREVRRAINLWKYQRWQEQGFPATGYD